MVKVTDLGPLTSDGIEQTTKLSDGMEEVIRLLHETPAKKDKTNPSHYQKHTAQLIEITESLNYCRGNVVKYAYRAGNKPGESALDDLRKARWYLNREIERLEKEADA